MQTFRYRAMTQSGELVNGSISAPTASEVAHRIEYLGLVPIETVAEEGAASVSRVTVAFFNRPRPEDVTVFTRDLALLLKAGARLDAGLELLADDSDIVRVGPADREQDPRRHPGGRESRRRGRPASRLFPADLPGAGAGRRDLRQAAAHPRDARQ